MTTDAIASPVTPTAQARLQAATRERDEALALAATLRGQLAQVTAAGASIADRAALRTQHADAEATVQELTGAIEILTVEADAEAAAAKRESLAAAQAHATEAGETATAALRDLESLVHGWARDTFAPRFEAATAATRTAQQAHSHALDLASEPMALRNRFEPRVFGFGGDDRARQEDYLALARAILAYGKYADAPLAPSHS